MVAKIATFNIKGPCYEDFVDILAFNGYMTRTTLKPQDGSTIDWVRTVEVFDYDKCFGKNEE